MRDVTSFGTGPGQGRRWGGKEGPDVWRHRFYLCLGCYGFVYTPAWAYWKMGLSESSVRKGDSHTENRSVDYDTLVQCTKYI